MVPLEALGGVDREQLYGVPARVRGRKFQAVLFVGRGLEPVQERGDVVRAGRGRELDRLVVEAVQVAPRVHGILPGQRGEFDIEAQHGLDLVDHGGQLVPEHTAQVSHVPAQCAQPAHALGTDPATARGDPALGGQCLERLDQARAVHDVRHDHGLLGILAGGGRVVGGLRILAARGPLVAALEGRGPVAECREVACTQPPPGTGEQSGEGIRAARIGEDVEHRDDVGDLRGVQQPTQPDHFVGDVPGFEFQAQGFELRAFAAQHGHGGHLVRGLALMRGPLVVDRRGHGLGLLGVREVAAHPHTTAHRTRRRVQRRDLDRGRGTAPRGRGAQRLGHGVRHLEDREAVAPRRGEETRVREPGRLHVRGPPDREVLHETEQLAGGRPPEAVDGLLGIAHGHDAVPLPEQSREQGQLGVGRVLELVQQDHREAFPLDRARVGVHPHDPCRECQQITVVERRVHALGRAEALHELREDLGLLHPAHGVLHLAPRGLLPPVRRGVQAHRTQPAHELVDPARFHEVLRGLGRQLHETRGERGCGGHGRGQRTVPALHEVVCELPGLGLTEQDGVRFHAQPKPVTAYERVRVGVVRADRGLLRRGRGVVVLGFVDESRAAQVPQLLVDPLGQFARGLAREGDPEDLVRAGQPVGHKPRDAIGHGGRLTRARARHDQSWGQRGRDHRGLLLGGREVPERLRDLVRGVPDVLR